ncbi:MAG: hypothetical protein E6I48_16995 [Chloroflexi bacterium]|nr:MAG: hypothetical protein E6I48_16995 [Chloroflexota bacterium]
MAIATAHRALVYLGLDLRPREAIQRHVGHVALLVAQMVELQNDWIRLAAIQAPMLAEVVPSTILILSATALVVRTNALELMIAISHVPVALVLGHASTTPHLPLSGIPGSVAELVERFSQSAPAAPSLIRHDRLIDHVWKRQFSDRDPDEGLFSFVCAKVARCLP